MRVVKWSVRDIVDILKARQRNKFDGNLAVSGDRGNGKSTIIGKIFYRFPKFRPKIHQVYNREDVIRLLRKHKYSLCFDDEAVNTGYKRDFQNRGQKELIKVLTAYRDNFNIHASAIPNFFSLDKDLRDLFFLHIHVIERGIAVIHMPLQGRLYSQDRWDSKYNAKVEENWSKKIQANPMFKPAYYKLSTFRGYLFFKDLTDKQRKLYEEVKVEKRRLKFDSEEELLEQKEKDFSERLYKLLIEKKLTRSGLVQYCLLEGKKYSSISTKLNMMLTDRGVKETVKDFLCPNEKARIESNVKEEINKIIPEVKEKPQQNYPGF